MASGNIFTIADTSLYASWEPHEGGIAVLHIPGVGVINMSLEKAEEISEDLARQVQYGRWHAMEERNDSGI